MSEEPFDRGVGVPHLHRAISIRQGLDDGPLGYAVAETKRPWSLRRGSVGLDLLRNTAQKCIEIPSYDTPRRL